MGPAGRARALEEGMAAWGEGGMTSVVGVEQAWLT